MVSFGMFRHPRYYKFAVKIIHLTQPQQLMAQELMPPYPCPRLPVLLASTLVSTDLSISLLLALSARIRKFNLFQLAQFLVEKEIWLYIQEHSTDSFFKFQTHIATPSQFRRRNAFHNNLCHFLKFSLCRSHYLSQLMDNAWSNRSLAAVLLHKRLIYCETTLLVSNREGGSIAALKAGKICTVQTSFVYLPQKQLKPEDEQKILGYAAQREGAGIEQALACWLAVASGAQTWTISNEANRCRCRHPVQCQGGLSLIRVKVQSRMESKRKLKLVLCHYYSLRIVVSFVPAHSWRLVAAGDRGRSKQ